MVIIANDDSAGFYAYVPRYPSRVGYIHCELSAGTAGGPIAAITTADRLGNR